MIQSFDDRENTQSLVGLLSLTWRAFKNFNMSFDAQYNHVDFMVYVTKCWTNAISESLRITIGKILLSVLMVVQNQRFSWAI